MARTSRSRFFRSLRFQTLAHLLCLLLVVGVMSFFAGTRVMDSSLAAYETSVASERFARITQGIELTLKSTQSSATDYAQWDETYEYMLNPQPTYLEDNYYASAMTNLGIDFVFFVDDSGRLVSYVDGRGEQPLFGDGRTSGLADAELVTPLDAFQRHNAEMKAANGYYLTTYAGAPIAMSYASIQPSEVRPDTVHVGWLVMARILDAKGLNSLHKLTGATILLFPTAEKTAHVLPAGYMTQTLHDSLGISPLTVAADPPPDLTRQRATGRQMLAWNTVFMVVLASLIAMFLLNRLILRRLANFSQLAEAHLAHGDDNTITWPVRGSDELDTLATSLNNMMDSLKHAERKLREEQGELLATKQHLEAANRLKDNFLATVSHELRTPMNGIVGAQELLKTTKPSPYQQDCLDTLSDSSALMSSMVERILLFSELQSGTIKLKPQIVDLQAWATRMQRVWAGIFQHKPVEFRLECSTLPEAWISADMIKLDQFVQELLRNAEKFTQHGRVTLGLSEIQNAGRWYLVIDIKDTGIGIPRHQQEAVMDMFRPTSARYTRSQGGLGIGLAITREVIRVLNGEWQLTSEEGQGTHIQARIPISIADAPGDAVIREPAAALPENAPSLPPSSSAGRILLVEDNPVNQKIMGKILDMLGWRHQLAINGQEAVEWAQREVFAVILMDCQMPVMDGLEASRLIRNTGNPNRATPIIAVTANVSDLDRDNCMAAGMNDYLAKPVKPQHIQDAIQRWTPLAPAKTG